MKVRSSALPWAIRTAWGRRSSWKILSQEWVYELCRPLVIGHDEVIRRALPLVRTGGSDDDEAQGGRTVPCLDIHPIEHPEAGPVPPRRD